MNIQTMTDGQLSQTITQAQALIAQQERDKALIEALPLALAEQERRTAEAIRRTEDAHASAAATVASVQRAADEWRAGLLALLLEAPQPPEVDAVSMAFGRGVPRDYLEAEGAFKTRLTEHVNTLGAIFQPLRAIPDRRNLPSVKVGLTEADAGRWFEYIEAVAGRWAAYF